MRGHDPSSSKWIAWSATAVIVVVSAVATTVARVIIRKVEEAAKGWAPQ